MVKEEIIIRILHISVKVEDMEEAIKFYRDIMGFELRSRGKAQRTGSEIVFFRDKESNSLIELSHLKEEELKKRDDLTKPFLPHIAIGVTDMDEAIKKFREHKVEIVLEPYSRKDSKTRIAFIKNNGMYFEIIDRK